MSLVVLGSSYADMHRRLFVFSKLNPPFIALFCSKCTFFFFFPRASDGDRWILQVREFIKLSEEQEEFFLRQQGEEAGAPGRAHHPWHVRDGDVCLCATLLSLYKGENCFGVIQYTWSASDVWCGTCHAKKGLIAPPDCARSLLWLTWTEPSTARGSEFDLRCPHVPSPLCWQAHSFWAWGHFRGSCQSGWRKWFCPLISALLGKQTNEIMPFKAMFQDTLIVRDLPIISLCEEWGYPEEKKIKFLSSHPTVLRIKSTACFSLQTWT